MRGWEQLKWMWQFQSSNLVPIDKIVIGLLNSLHENTLACCWAAADSASIFPLPVPEFWLLLFKATLWVVQLLSLGSDSCEEEQWDVWPGAPHLLQELHVSSGPCPDTCLSCAVGMSVPSHAPLLILNHWPSGVILSCPHPCECPMDLPWDVAAHSHCHCPCPTHLVPVLPAHWPPSSQPTCPGRTVATITEN